MPAEEEMANSKREWNVMGMEVRANLYLELREWIKRELSLEKVF